MTNVISFRRPNKRGPAAFTLIELLVVIAISQGDLLIPTGHKLYCIGK